MDARRLWADDGSRSAGARLARDACCAPETGKDVLKRARKLRTMPLTTNQHGNGVLSTDHVDVLARANRPDIAHLFARDEAMLVGYADTLTFDQFHRAVRHWMNCADDEMADADAERSAEGRHLHVDRSRDGQLDLVGRLEAVGGAVFADELERIEQELFEADWAEARAEHGPDATAHQLRRTAPQRRADALVEMARRSAARPEAATDARPLIAVLVGLETFTGRICELADGTVLTLGQVVPLLSSADVERVVFDSPSRVIDVGRRARFFTGALRRAIEVRDRHCTFPGCTVPAHRCQVDHIVEWADGGPTVQENGRLLCPAHNRQRPGRAHPPPNSADDGDGATGDDP